MYCVMLYTVSMEYIGVITAKEVKDWMDRGDDFLLVDVRSKEGFEDKHLPGAKHAPVHDDNFLKKMEQLSGGDQQATIVVYCSSPECQASPTAAKKLAMQGYEAVYDFDEGVAGWMKAGYQFAE